VSRKVVIGIDPGIHGAVAAIDAGNREVLYLEDVPTFAAGGKTMYDVNGMAEAIRRAALMGDAVATLEQSQAMPGQGSVSTWSTGRSFGLWEGVLGALGVAFSTVRPSYWTRRVLAGMPGEGKARSINFAAKMFPGCELIPPGCRKPKDGRADALCLAYYGTL
jgi:crossover junction endodeoxyribonuclease RuvC